MKPLELLPALGPGSGVRKCEGIAYHDEITVAQPGRARPSSRPDVAFAEECDWFALWLKHSRNAPASIDFNNDVQANEVSVFLDGLEVCRVHRQTREATFTAATMHVRFLWLLALGASR